MMICDADFDEIFPGCDRVEAGAAQPLQHARLFMLMPAAATMIAASQALQSAARIANLMPWRFAQAPS